MTEKDRVVEAIRALPDDARIEDVIDRLHLLYKIERGLGQADAGQLISQAEVRARMARWLTA
jgi:predicted transcriptional regulator